jgi:Fe-S oxidoreductase
MDRQRVRDWEAQCIQEQPPACTAGCPVHVDARAMAGHARAGNFKAGFAEFAKAVPLPHIVCRVCDHPCEAVCKRAEAGDAVRIRALERACVAFGHDASVLPRRQKNLNGKRVAVVGAGLSGLTVALDLAVKGHDVVVFEARRRPLEQFREGTAPILPDTAIEADLARLAVMGIELRCNTRVDLGRGERGLSDLTKAFDAVYLGVGRQQFDAALLDLDPAGRIAIAPVTYATSHPKVFAGGSQRYQPEPFSPITSLQDGRYAGLSISRLLQGASLSAGREGEGSYPTRLFTNTHGIASVPAVEPAGPEDGYSRDEAVLEAARCFPCACLECVKACDYLAEYKSYPKRYVREIYNNDGIVMGVRRANRMVNSCSLCGLCGAICPENLNMAEVCLDARESMVASGHMPPSLHEFALRDMAFSTSEAFAMARHAPGLEASAVVFFPGCQLSASSPSHVASAYDFLRTWLPGGVGLMLGCCGAPAHWAGQRDLFASTLATITGAWEGLGRPRIVTACSSCYRMFRDHLRDLPVSSLWTVLDEYGPPPVHPSVRGRPVAIHDPCTTRDDADIQRSVRRILVRQGVEYAELNEPGYTTCCGYGGLMAFANRAVADKVVRRRVAESERDYLTYCAMCRDVFARSGKRALHVLDVLFAGEGADAAARADPGFSRRRENRARLKTRLLREVWGEEMTETSDDLDLIVSADVLMRLEQKQILLEDVREVIRRCERSGEKLLDARSGHALGRARPGHVTYWVEYSAEGSRFVVHNAYSHRMQIG